MCIMWNFQPILHMYNSLKNACSSSVSTSYNGKDNGLKGLYSKYNLCRIDSICVLN